jgi:hypothetical protein
MKYVITHTFDIRPDAFWQRVFFDSEYNRDVFCGLLKCSAYEELELTRSEDGGVRRAVRIVPNLPMPAPLKAMFGPTASYTETGAYDPATGQFVATITPNMAADVISTHMTTWLVPRSSNQVERHIEIDNRVKIFGIGGRVEAALAKQTRETNDLVAAFTADWIARARLNS